MLRNRCYGGEPGEVAAVGRAVAEGLLAGGVLPVMKHMPGQGRARRSTATSSCRGSRRRRAELAEDFAPFRALADLPMAMTAHVVYRGARPRRAGDAVAGGDAADPRARSASAAC